MHGTSCVVRRATRAPSLAYPLLWCHVYIPVLPRTLTQVLQAPMPFIVGVSHETYVPVVRSARPGALALHRFLLIANSPHFVRAWHTSYKAAHIPPQVVRVDLDRNEVSSGVPVIPLPPKQKTKLLKALRQCANAYSRRAWDWAMHELPSKDSAFKNAMRPSDMPRAEPGTVIDWVETRRLFLKIFTHNLQNYRSCLIFPDNQRKYVLAHPAPPPTGPLLHDRALTTARGLTTLPSCANCGLVCPVLRSYERFNNHQFLYEVHKKVPSSHPFLKALIVTQLFQNFVDDRIQPDEDDVDVIYFDEELIKKEARHFGVKKFLKKVETPFLDSTEYGITKTKVALTPDVSGVPPTESFRCVRDAEWRWTRFVRRG